MERVEQLVSVDVFARSLVSAGNSLKLEETLVFQRGQKCVLPFPPVLDPPEQHSAVLDGCLDNLTVSAIKIAGLAVEVRDPSNFNLCFNAYLKDCQPGVSKSGNFRQKLRFGFQLWILNALISVNRARVMHGNESFLAAPVDPHLPCNKPRQPGCGKLVDI